ncbi:hypothetical protein E2562_018096 [Oryza meyeriana var. granulata]|uniref:Uncharacterized protein n=1 Tax=Oryza meyeriana var. granulata TaxID=110450 RepID=A0A6G1CSN9_9ORYZ|nr:hypothetical protein E2562_018096 [Oryza meyeriana var. granulata]
MDKVEEAAAAVAADEDDGDVGEEESDLWPVEALPEPTDDAGPRWWSFGRFDQIDGLVEESFLEALRKDAEAAEAQALRDAEAAETRSPDSRPSSSKRQRADTASPPHPSSSSSSRSPYRNILQVFQQCKQDVA